MIPRGRADLKSPLAIPHSPFTCLGETPVEGADTGFLKWGGVVLTFVAMSTLAEIEAATEGLTPEQREELFLFLAARLRSASDSLPTPREFTSEQIEGWIADDDAEMRRFRQGQ
jgi:hypothetical protein